MVKSGVDRLLEALDDASAKVLGDDEKRPHLGASIIGHECGRFLWYSYRWADDVKHPAKVLRIFERGDIEEPRLVRWLKEAGATVWEKDPGTGGQFRFSEHDGRFGGSVDGVATKVPGFDPDDVFLLEFKTHNERNWKKFVSDGVLTSHRKHYVQMQLYMHKLGLGRALYFAVNKNTEEIACEVIEASPNVAEHYSARAKDILDDDIPPPRISEDPSWFVCRFCDFNKVCFGTKPPHHNCRTCCHWTSTGRNGYCERHKAVPELPEYGCRLHLPNPHMLTGWVVEEADTVSDEPYLTVRRKSGNHEVVRLGHLGVSSRDFFEGNW